MAKKLVIVESPAKARTLGKILGRGYSFKASLGHVRDLPKSKLGVDVENNFEPSYVVPRLKTKLVNELKKAAKDASTVYLATDPDREGEAISWHLLKAAGIGDKPHYRVVFHEITKEAVIEAFKHPREIDENIVNAQQARRVIDRLVGYRISPLLWKKVQRGLSAGRVQSVAMKIIVDREREILAFKPEEYWSIAVELSKKVGKNGVFTAQLHGLEGKKKYVIDNQKLAETVAAELKESVYQVAKITAKKASRQPAPPFITSTMQQEAWRKFRFSAKQTMALAQQLYEGLPVGAEGTVGLITYMRTDSTNVARTALAETREYIGDKYGQDYLPTHARTFTSRVKGAQEAHEAIRPTSIKREPDQIKQYLNANQAKLYRLIWQRMVASQMSAAAFNNTAVDIKAVSPGTKNVYALKSNNSVMTFPGFTVLYVESVDTETAPEDSPLPGLVKDEALLMRDLESKQHFTQPPPRYTEATLIKVLEQRGIGRPSTYATIMSTIQDREYTGKVKGSFKPSTLGMTVNDLLVENFADIFDIDFTARLEDELDEVAQKKREWVTVVRSVYTPLAVSLEKANVELERVELPDEFTGENCPKCGRPLVVKTGRFGKFIGCQGYGDKENPCKYTTPYMIKTGVKCPECKEGDLVQRLNKRRKVFYGCSRFPDCRFLTNSRPLPQPCPKCGGLMTVYRDNQARCSGCDHRQKLPASETPAD
jgi:DNA topoisomerase I